MDFVGLLLLVTIGAAPTTAPVKGQLLQTTESPVSGAATPDRLTPYDVSFNASADPAAMTFAVSPSEPLQAVLGFGGAITDAVAHVFNLMPAALQEEATEALWGATGQRYSVGRITIGSTDFSTGV